MNSCVIPQSSHEQECKLQTKPRHRTSFIIWSRYCTKPHLPLQNVLTEQLLQHIRAQTYWLQSRSHAVGAMSWFNAPLGAGKRPSVPPGARHSWVVVPLAQVPASGCKAAPSLLRLRVGLMRCWTRENGRQHLQAQGILGMVVPLAQVPTSGCKAAPPSGSVHKTK